MQYYKTKILMADMSSPSIADFDLITIKKELKR